MSDEDKEYLKNLGMLLLSIWALALCLGALLFLVLWSNTPGLGLPAGPVPFR